MVAGAALQAAAVGDHHRRLFRERFRERLVRRVRREAHGPRDPLAVIILTRTCVQYGERYARPQQTVQGFSSDMGPGINRSYRLGGCAFRRSAAAACVLVGAATGFPAFAGPARAAPYQSDRHDDR